MPRIICSQCGTEDLIRFAPEEGQPVLCNACYRRSRDRAEAKQASRHVPRKKHGTRVQFQIVCSKCGREDTLDYVPKGTPMSEMLCKACAREKFGDESQWSQMRQKKQEEQRTEWEFTCAECGRTDYLKFKPDPRRDYFCTRCFREQEDPSPERLKDKQSIDDAVFIRKKRDDH